MKALYRFIAWIYLNTWKNILTWLFNAVYCWPEAPVQQFNDPESAVYFYKVAMGNPYTGDPFRGALDFYTPPGALQVGLNTNTIHKLWVDCDDVAVWYSQTQDPNRFDCKLVTIVDRWIRGSHVICLVTDRVTGRKAVMDTTGFTALPDHEEDTVCNHFTKVYEGLKYSYIVMVPTSTPFA